jgi:hypothetical protein
MTSKPFITMNAGQVKVQIEQINRNLDRIADKVLAAAQQAMVEVANDMLATAQARAPVMSAELQASGTVLPVEVKDGEISIQWGFNKVYARIQDQGGTIVPVKAQLLAIPLDPIMTATGPRFPSPRAEGDNLELVPILHHLFLADKTSGEFHWLLVPSVKIEGSGYVTKTVEEMKDQLPQRISDRVSAILSSGSSPKA